MKEIDIVEGGPVEDSDIIDDNLPVYADDKFILW